MDLTGFYRAKVISNEDDQMDGRLQVFVVNLKRTIWVRPSNSFGSSENDMLNYKAQQGSYDSPRNDSYVVVFFLENDLNQGFYAPGMTLKYSSQTPKGMNLPKFSKLNFMKLATRANIKFKEFFNGNIVGVDLNDDTNHFFLIFDNGARMEFSSPNEIVKQGKRSSSISKFTNFILDSTRKDSYFGGKFQMLSNKTESSAEVSVSSRSENPGSADTTSYRSGNKLRFLTVVKSFFKIREDGGSHTLSVSGSSNETESLSSITSSKSVDNSGVTSNDTLLSVDEVNDKKATITKSENADTIEGLSSSRKSEFNTSEISHEIDERRELNADKFSDEMSLKMVLGEELPENEKSATVFSDEDGIRETTTSIVNDNASEKKYSLTESSDVNKNGVTKASVVAHDGSEVGLTSEVVQKITGSKLTSSSTLSKNDQSQSSVKQEVDIESGESKLTIINKFSIQNPADPSGVLELDPKFQRGHKVVMDATEDKSSIEVTSIKKAFPTDAAGKPKYGEENSIKLTEDGKEASFEINLMGGTPGGGITLKIETDGSGKFTLELPKGDMNIKAPAGTVNVEANILNATVNDSAVIKVTNKVELTATSVTAKVTDLKVEATSAEVIAKKIKIAGDLLELPGTPIPDPTGGTMCAIKLCPFSGLPHQAKKATG